MSESRSTIIVSGEGKADANYTSVHYSATVTGTGSNTLAAKKNAQALIAQLRQVLEESAAEAQVDQKTGVKADFSTRAVSRYDRDKGENVPSGYQATYKLQFTGKNVDAATKLHDKLTSIQSTSDASVAVESPQFCVDDSRALENVAFARAAADARQRFEDQARVLGLDPDKYDIETWSPGHDSGYGNKAVRMASLEAPAGAMMDAPIELETGGAERVVHVSVTFVRRPSFGG